MDEIATRLAELSTELSGLGGYVDSVDQSLFAAQEALERAHAIAAEIAEGAEPAEPMVGEAADRLQVLVSTISELQEQVDAARQEIDALDVQVRGLTTGP